MMWKGDYHLPPRRFREAMLSLFSANAPPDHGLETYFRHKKHDHNSPNKKANRRLWFYWRQTGIGEPLNP